MPSSLEPRAGFPTKVDREYVIIQSEFYAKLDPDKREVDGAPLYVLDGERLRAARPTHTVFNGVHNGMVKRPLPAKAGERVRLYVLNVGPSKTSSFHVVGTIFDRVHQGGPGGLGNPPAGRPRRAAPVARRQTELAPQPAHITACDWLITIAEIRPCPSGPATRAPEPTASRSN